MELSMFSGVPMDNVIAFPKENKRLDVSNTPTSIDEVAMAIEKMKLDFYHDVADNLMDHVVQSIGSLNLDSSHNEEIHIREVDIILMREVLTAFMCRLGGVNHPLKGLADAVVKDLNVEEGSIDYRVTVPGSIPEKSSET
jgi:hypothetical protein